MAATIEVVKTTGASGSETVTSVSGIALKDVDDATTTAPNSPIVILDSGWNYSYESWLRFKVAVAPDNQCTDFKVWGSGAAIQTGNVRITLNTDAVDTYVTPVKTQCAQGTRADFASHGVGSKVDVAGTLVNVDDVTDFVVFQLEVDDVATPGNIAQQTIYYSYLET